MTGLLICAAVVALVEANCGHLAIEQVSERDRKDGAV